MAEEKIFYKNGAEIMFGQWDYIKKIRILLIALWIVGIAILLLIFGEGEYLPLPSVAVEKETDFDGKSAYDYVDRIAKSYQYRIFGSETDQLLGNDIAKEFYALGMEVEKQEFTSWRPNIEKFFLKFDLVDNDVNIFSDCYNTLIEVVSGTNIIGISQGCSDDIVLIGAHRDIASGIQGAEDNASGTGVMLQLAKELTASEHYYTYVFVSFDGEEAQEKGSQFFVDEFSEIEKVKLAIILDQVGYSEADSLMSYGKYGGFEQLSSQTQSLLKSCLDVTGTANVSFNPEYAPNKGIASFVSHMFGKSFDSINTDCNPFYKRCIPSFGVKAINAKRMTEPIVHCKEDNMDIVSINTLKMSGNFVKTILSTVDKNRDLEALLDKDDYIITGDSYLPSKNVLFGRIVFEILIVLSITAEISILVKQYKKNMLARHLIIGGLGGLLTIVLFTFLRYGASGIFSNLGIFFFGGIWVCLLVLGTIYIRRMMKGQSAVQFSFTFHRLLNYVLFFICAFFAFEYAVIILVIAAMATILIQIGSRIRAIRIGLFTLYIAVHSIIMVASCNVFLRGVDPVRFWMVQIIGIYYLVLFSIFSFAGSEKEETEKL